MRLIICIIGFFLALSSFAKQRLVIGIIPYNPPFSSLTDNTHFSGFEISLIDEICKRINADCTYKKQTFSEFPSSLDNRTIDLAVGTIIINEDRKQGKAFSLPYLVSRGSIIVNNNKSKSIYGLIGKRVATMQGSLYEKELHKWLGNDAVYLTYPDIQSMVDALAKGETDAVIVDSKVGRFIITQFERFALVKETINTGNGYGIMARQSDQTLINQINKALISMQEDGTYAKIFRSFF